MISCIFIDCLLLRILKRYDTYRRGYSSLQVPGIKPGLGIDLLETLL